MSMLRAFVHSFSDWLHQQAGDSLFADPGLVFFPKKIFNLNPAEMPCPSGNQVEYVALALAKRRQEQAGMSQAADQDFFRAALNSMRVETEEALVVERLLLARLEKGEA